jgi:hypothetical protein
MYIHEEMIVVGSISSNSYLADFTKSINNSCVFDGFKIISVVPKTTPCSIYLIFSW